MLMIGNKLLEKYWSEQLTQATGLIVIIAVQGLLKSAVSYREFRMFLDVVHMGVEHLLYTQGAEPFRCINRGMDFELWL